MKNNYIYYTIISILALLLISYIATDFIFFKHIPKDKELKQNESKDKINNIYKIKVNPNDNFVFLGDSLTERYSLEEFYDNLPVVNSGVGGNTTDNILDNMKERVYQYNPSKVFLQVGINDLKKEKSVDYIYDNILKIVDEITKNRKQAKIYVISIYPINDSDDEKISENSIKNRNNSDIDKINKKLEKYFNNTKITYIDVNKELKDKDNRLKLEYTEEGVHLTPLGYLKVTATLLPYLQD